MIKRELAEFFQFLDEKYSIFFVEKNWRIASNDHDCVIVVAVEGRREIFNFHKFKRFLFVVVEVFRQQNSIFELKAKKKKKLFNESAQIFHPWIIKFLKFQLSTLIVFSSCEVPKIFPF